MGEPIGLQESQEIDLVWLSLDLYRQCSSNRLWYGVQIWRPNILRNDCLLSVHFDETEKICSQHEEGSQSMFKATAYESDPTNVRNLLHVNSINIMIKLRIIHVGKKGIIYSHRYLASDPLFTKQADILPQGLMKSRSREIRLWTFQSHWSLTDILATALPR